MRIASLTASSARTLVESCPTPKMVCAAAPSLPAPSGTTKFCCHPRGVHYATQQRSLSPQVSAPTTQKTIVSAQLPARSRRLPLPADTGRIPTCSTRNRLDLLRIKPIRRNVPVPPCSVTSDRPTSGASGLSPTAR